jgi:hypothetical protein
MIDTRFQFLFKHHTLIKLQPNENADFSTYVLNCNFLKMHFLTICFFFAFSFKITLLFCEIAVPNALSLSSDTLENDVIIGLICF